jgi:hypothetical protein
MLLLLAMLLLHSCGIAVALHAAQPDSLNLKTIARLG